MDIHRQQCQNCGSFEARNILARQPDLPTTVYVRCGSCGQLVARYQLSEYYHHGKDMESFLKSRGVTSAESGRDMLAEFKQIEKQALDGYKNAMQYLKEHKMPI